MPLIRLIFLPARNGLWGKLSDQTSGFPAFQSLLGEGPYRILESATT